MEFILIDFVGHKMKNRYQSSKVLKFFTSLQAIKPLIKKFSTNEFRK